MDGIYYVPLSRDFPAIGALTKERALLYSVTDNHPIKGIQTLSRLTDLYPNDKLPLLFIVPDCIADEFKKQPILTANVKAPKSSTIPSIHQWVAGIPLGVNISPPIKKRRIN